MGALACPLALRTRFPLRATLMGALQCLCWSCMRAVLVLPLMCSLSDCWLRVPLKLCCGCVGVEGVVWWEVCVAWRRREPVARPAMLAVILWDGVLEGEYVATSLSCDVVLEMEASQST